MKTYLKDAVASRLMSGDGPFRAFLSEGAPETRVAVVTGPNASGKSLFVRVLAATLNEEKVEPLQVSMRYRTSSGMHRAFMFGNDEDQSTGATSLYAIMGGLKASRTRERAHWLLLDEPDIGLAEEYATSLGLYLAEYANALPELAKGFVLVSHSRALIRAFMGAMVQKPHFVHLEQERTLEEWLAPPVPRSVEDLLALDEIGHQRWQAVESLLRDARKKQR